MFSRIRNIYLFRIIVVLLVAELICRTWDAIDAYQHYRSLLSQFVIYRDQNYSISKPSGTKRIILLGGSAAYDTIDDYKKTWPYQMERILNEKDIGKIEVINLGYFSETSTDELFKLNDFGMQLDPDLVIVFDGFNDVYNLWHHYDYWKRLYEIKAKIILNEKKHHPVTQLNKWIKQNSSLYRRGNQFKKWLQRQLSLKALAHKKNLYKKQLAAGKLSSSERADKFSPIHPPQDLMANVGKGPQGDQFFETPSSWNEILTSFTDIYSNNHEKMAKLILRGNAKGLYIFQPDLSYKPELTTHVSAEEKREYLSIVGNHENPWQLIQKLAYPEGLRIKKSIAQKYGFSFHDFNERILLRNNVADLFEGNVHFSDKGRNVIAHEIASIILKEGLLNKK